jgi:hypothetical protein
MGIEIKEGLVVLPRFVITHKIFTTKYFLNVKTIIDI